MDNAIWAGVIGGSFAVLAALLPTALEKYKRWKRQQIEVKQITVADDPDLVPALELFEKAIPENQRDMPEDIVRWLGEIQEETREGRCRWADYLLVARLERAVVGFLYAHYDLDTGLLLISYLVVDKLARGARGGRASAALLGHLLGQLRRRQKKCHGIVFELEYAGGKSKEKDRERRARMHRFRGLAQTKGITVKEIQMDYRQPKLSLWEPGRREERQHLMFGRMNPPHLSNLAPRREVENVLDFVYNHIYGDQFADEPARDTEYRQYLKGLYQKCVAGLPENVPLI